MNLSNLSWLREGGYDLFVESYANTAVVVQIRGYTESEQVIHDHTTNSNRSLSSSVVAITGSPIFLTARSLTANIVRGQCYVRVSLRIEGIIVATLFAGYVSTLESQAFPNGAISSPLEGGGHFRVITGTDPASGSDFSESVPTGAMWRVQSVISTLSCDATVINRTAHIIFDDGASVVYRSLVNSNVVASQTAMLVWGNSGAAGVTTGVSPHGFIPDSMHISAGFRVRSSIVGLQAGDDLDAPVLYVEEFMNP